MQINETHPREKGFVLWGHCQNILDDPRMRNALSKGFLFSIESALIMYMLDHLIYR